MTTRRSPNDHGAGAHRSPRRLFVDAIERSLGWCSEKELRAIVERYTGVRMSLGDCNSFSQEVAALVVGQLMPEECCNRGVVNPAHAPFDPSCEYQFEHVRECIRDDGVVIDRKRMVPKTHLSRALPYLLQDEIASVWEACSLVTSDAEVAAWLASRAIPPQECADLDLCRALGPRLPHPAHATGLSWLESGHRCIVPVFDESGKMRSVLARSIRVGSEPKCFITNEHLMGGLVMANSVAQEVLTAGDKPTWWPTDAVLRIVVAEGVPDFLTWATRSRRHDPPLAVLGVESGSWTKKIARRIPNNARIIIRTHHDQSGNAHATIIAGTLGDRCEVLRANPGGLRRPLCEDDPGADAKPTDVE